MTLVGGDGEEVGTITDIWVDKAEYVIRYLGAEVETAPGLKRSILVPIVFTRIDGRRGTVTVKALYAQHFANVPGLKDPSTITLREEDRIQGYYGGGTLYASPKRLEPLL